jgi:hypothetical protein
MSRTATQGLLSAIAIAALSREVCAQKITLQLRPRVGDTISMRLDQQTEVSSRRETGRTPAPTSSAPSSASMTSTTVTFSRAVIESAVASYTTVVAITDSVLMSSTDQHGQASAAAMQHQLQGQRVRLTIAPDGSIQMPRDASAPAKGMSRTASLIPATFPAKPIAVGDKWMREAPLPAGTSQLGTGIVGWVKATFRLDSVTHGGDLAFVSMHGDLQGDPKTKGAEGVATVEDGTVDGYMVVDRARGWLTESQFSIVAHSTLRPTFGVVTQPMHFEVRLTQSLRTIDKR